MKLVSNTKLEENLYELKIRVDGEEYKTAFEKSVAKNSKKLNIPGFRKGKAPRAMVMKMVGEAYFYDDAINDTYQAAYSTALDESGLEPVDKADVSIEEATGEGYTFVAKVTVKPEVSLKGYTGLPATKKIVSLSDEEIDAELARMADRNSRLVDVDDRAAAEGDAANINFEGFVDGVAFAGGKGENYDLVLGSGQFIPGFEEQIVGKSIAEEFDVNVTFPEEYHADELKGKPAVFKVRLNSLKYKEMPEIDDEFAKDVSEFDTLELLKADMREKMTENKQRHADEDMENELCALLAEKLEATIPPVMFEHKIDEMVQDFAYRMQSQGMQLNDYLMYTGSDMEKFRDGFRAEAEKQVKISLALEKIAEIEKIVPTAEDIASEYERAAKMYNIDVEKVKTFIKEENIADSLKMNKAIDFLKANAKITEVAEAEEAAPKKTRAKAAKAKTEEADEAKETKKSTKPRAKKATKEDPSAE